MVDITGDQIVRLLPALGVGAALPALFNWLKEKSTTARKAETDTIVAREAEETKRDMAEDTFELQLIGNLQTWAERLLSENEKLRTSLLLAEERRLHAEARTTQLVLENDSLRERLALPSSTRNRDLLLGTTAAASTPPAPAPGSATAASTPSIAPPTATTISGEMPRFGEEPTHHHD